MKTAKVTIRLLREFSVETPEVGVSELARRLDLDKATVHRLLRALCEEGIVEQNLQTRKYRLGLSILDLAAARLKTLGFVEIAIEKMRGLREQLGETIALHVRDGYDTVCVQYIEASYPLTARFILGERSPVHVTASGLVALAEIDGDGWEALALAAAQAYPAYADIQPADIAASIESARRDGIAIADETYQKGVRAIATAIRDRQGSMVGALSLVAPVTRLGVPELLGDAGLLIETARQIGEKIPGGIEMLTSGRGKVFQSG